MHKNIKLLLTASILIHAGANLLAPIYAIFIEEIGGTLLDAGIAVGIYALMKGGFEKMADKFVDLNGDMSRDDIIALLKHRLEPVR